MQELGSKPVKLTPIDHGTNSFLEALTRGFPRSEPPWQRRMVVRWRLWDTEIGMMRSSTRVVVSIDKSALRETLSMLVTPPHWLAIAPLTAPLTNLDGPAGTHHDWSASSVQTQTHRRPCAALPVTERGHHLSYR